MSAGMVTLSIYLLCALVVLTACLAIEESEP